MKFKKLVSVTTRESTDPRFSSNGGDYSFGYTIAVDNYGRIVGGYHWCSHDWGCCEGCGANLWNDDNIDHSECKFSLSKQDSVKIEDIETTDTRVARLRVFDHHIYEA